VVAAQECVATKPVRRPKRPKRETSIIVATVTRVERFRPRVQRVTLHSPEFAGFITDIPDQFITFIFPFPNGDRTAPAVGRDFDWDDLFGLDEAARPHARNYTVRHYRPELNEVDVDMILHGDEGRGSVWAMEAQPGDVLAIWGPRVVYDPPPGVTWQLLVADDAGIPAIAAILETLPPAMQARVIVEVDGPEDVQPLESRAQVETTWLYRTGRHAGESQALIQAVRDLELPAGVRYAWGGGEYRTMNAIGKYLRREQGFRPSDVATVGYW
jgi:NADPH-dependent ferric siderophore reductase